MPLPEARFAVLMFTDIVDSTGLKPAHGVPAYLAAFARHNALLEDLARRFPAMHILQHTGDGFFASFAGVSDAVRFALLLQHAMRQEKWTGLTLATRIGIHAGEVAVASPG
jgi:class 3 adenylate cyclase